MRPGSPVEDEPEIVRKAYERFREYFLPRQLFFDKDTSEKVLAVVKKIDAARWKKHEASVRIQSRHSAPFTDDETDDKKVNEILGLEDEAWKIVSREVPCLMEQLMEDFRCLLEKGRTRYSLKSQRK
jgi:hypothetical protein